MNELKDNFERTLLTGETFVLTPEDLEKSKVDNTGKEINTIDDLVMVHKTSFFPSGAIKTPYDTGKKGKTARLLNLDGEKKEYEIPVQSYRKTVHFCLNGGVESHAYGNWDSSKYAIFMPLSKNKEQIVAGTECDLFAEGSVPINESAYILCPTEEIEKMKIANPNAKVIGYEGTSVSPYINFFLSNILGYKQKTPTQSSSSNHWETNDKDRETAEKIIKDNGWVYGIHYYSKWFEEELYLERLNKLLAVLKITLDNDILYEEKNVEFVKNEILSFVQNALNSGLAAENEGLKIASGKGTIWEILEKLRDELGIDLGLTEQDLSLLEQKLFENKDMTTQRLTPYYQDTMGTEITNRLVSKIREKCLFEKKSKGILTEKEKIVLQGLEEIGADVTKQIDDNMVEQYESLLSREIRELTDEELQVVLSILNMKLRLISKKASQSNQLFELQKLNGITSEQSEIFRQADEYVPVREAGIYLKFKAPDKITKISSLTEIDLSEIENKINSDISGEELYQALKSYKTVPNSHFDDFEDGITDCDLLTCQNVRELAGRVMQYAKSFERFYNGESIQFDKNGNFPSSTKSYGIPSNNNDYLGFAAEKPKADDGTQAMEYLPFSSTKQRIEELQRIREALAEGQTPEAQEPIEYQSGFSM